MLLKKVLFGALLALIATSASALDAYAVFTAVRPSLVQVVGVAGEGRLQLGSGVALPNGTVVTNCHVTSRARRVQLFFANTTASLQSAEVNKDLCALYFPDIKKQPATIRPTADLKIGETVYAVGFNAGGALSYQAGEVAELFEHEGAKVVRTTAAFTHGASGGGLFDSEGRLVGILTFFRVAKGRTDYFAVPVEWLDRLDRAKAEPIAPLPGLPFWAADVQQQPAFLRAGALEADGQWDQLAELARSWTVTRPTDGQAWSMLGKAAAQLGDSSLAQTAFRRAEELGVVHPAAARETSR
ncbi:MAG TPA: trypsin-like peptidase domain-containing protein [Burkholderiales bacterium]|nr:trypsin-like peptidase domain-containing protein [Burkholderiales bacterium]